MSLESLGKEVDSAKQYVRNARESGWTKHIDEMLLPPTILKARDENRLQNLIQEVFEETMKIHPRKQEVTKYILDWLFATATYFLIEQYESFDMTAYEKLIEYTKTL